MALPVLNALRVAAGFEAAVGAAFEDDLSAPIAAGDGDSAAQFWVKSWDDRRPTPTAEGRARLGRGGERTDRTRPQPRPSRLGRGCGNWSQLAAELDPGPADRQPRRVPVALGWLHPPRAPSLCRGSAPTPSAPAGFARRGDCWGNSGSPIGRDRGRCRHCSAPSRGRSRPGRALRAARGRGVTGSLPAKWMLISRVRR